MFTLPNKANNIQAMSVSQRAGPTSTHKKHAESSLPSSSSAASSSGSLWPIFPKPIHS